MQAFLIAVGLSVAVSMSYAQELTGAARQEWIRQELAKDPRVKILNNFCWELFDQTFDSTTNEVAFNLPVDRWIFIQDGDADSNGGQFRLNDELTPIEFRPYKGRGEAMRRLKAGTHRLKFAARDRASTRRLVVRAVPSIHHAYFGAEKSIIDTFGPYDWQFLERYVNPHINVMVGMASPPAPVVDAWKRSGRRWITLVKALFKPDLKELESENLQLLDVFWGAGMRAAYSDGILVDEIGENNPYYDVFQKAADLLLQDGTLAGRTFNTYGYGSGMADTDAGRAFGNWVARNGGELAVELYLMDTTTLHRAERKIRNELIGGMKPWINAFPVDALTVTLCSCNQPAENANRSPGTDFNVFLDMQMQALANDESCFALAGVQTYYASYSDEEIIRWTAQLFRHYCLEGATERFSKNPYELPHLINPDFAKGTEGWTIEPAESGSIEPRTFPNHGVLQARWGGSETGNNFLWMRRCSGKTNKVSQTIQNLVPGQTYSLKLYSGDYTDLVQGKAAKKWPGIFVSVTGADLLDGRRQSFVYAYPHSFGRVEGAFTGTNQYWNNYHWQVFRATAPTATLSITDWMDSNKSGGPIGQESTFNFVEVQPYFEGEQAPPAP